jgi:hypothetical protein
MIATDERVKATLAIAGAGSRLAVRLPCGCRSPPDLGCGKNLLGGLANVGIDVSSAGKGYP